MLPKAQVFSPMSAALSKTKPRAGTSRRRSAAGTVKLFERDDKVLVSMGLSEDTQNRPSPSSRASRLEDDTPNPSSPTNVTRRSAAISDRLSQTERRRAPLPIRSNKVVTNRLGLPILSRSCSCYIPSPRSVPGHRLGQRRCPRRRLASAHIRTSAYNDAMDEYAQNFVFTDEAAAAEGTCGRGKMSRRH